MFNLKTFVNKITDRGGRDSQSDSTDRPGFEDDLLSKQAAEGFLCPKCMKAFLSPEELQAHYQASHDSAEDSASYDSASASPGAGFYGLHQEVGERYKLSRQNGNSISQERLTAEIQGITDVAELQKSLLDALETKSQLQLEKETLEQRIVLLARRNDDEQNNHTAMKERLEIVEAQLAHRESIDDAAVLRQELVLVQRAMDEMTRESERERDLLKTELLQLKSTCAQEKQANASSESERVSELLHSIEATEAELKHTQMQLDQLGNSFKAQVLETEGVKKEIEGYKIRLSKSLGSAEETKKQLALVKEQVNVLNSQSTEQASQLKLKDIEIATAQSQVDFYKSKSESVSRDKMDGVADEGEWAQRISEKEERIKQLTRELTELVAQNDRDGAAVPTIQLLTMENQAMCALIDERTAQRELALRKIAEVEQACVQTFELKQQAAASNLITSKLEDELKLKTQQLQDMENRAKDMTTELMHNEKVLCEIRDLFHGATLSDVAKNISQLTADKLNLETALSNLDDEHNAKEVVNMDLMRKVDQLGTENDDVKTALTSLQEEHKTLEKSNADLSTTVEQLQVENAVLTTSLTEIRENYNLMENESFDLSKRVDQLTDKIRANEVDMKHEMNKYSDLQFQLQGSIETVSVKEGIIVDLQNANQDQLHEYLHLEQQLNSAKSQLLTLSAKLTTQESEMQAMTVKQTSLETVIFELEKTKAELELDNRNMHLLADQTVATNKKERADLERRYDEQLAVAENKYKVVQDILNEQKAVHDTALAELLAVHSTDLDRKDSELRKLQTALDDVAGEKLALEALLQASQSEHKSLLEKYYTSCNEHDTQRRAIDDLRRRSDDSQSALHELGRENQILRLELEKLLGRKWTEDSDVASCHLCHKEFTLLVRKHHCRNCGQIFCNECSTKNAQIANNKRPVRVCDGCFNELVSPSSPGAI